MITAHDPLSTFAADVDTASYDIFRRDINFGLLPDVASVRLEEWVNNFKYHYAAPPEEQEAPFEIALDAAPSLAGDDSLVMRVGIQARLPPPEQKKPTNLVFLVDTSGSMMDRIKLPLVQQVLTGAVDLLDPSDTISIVTYAGSTAVALTPTPVQNKESIQTVIDGLVASGGTAGGAGLTLAYAQAEAAFLEGGVNHILLCTDGDFNIGISSTDELLSLIEEKRKTGVTLTALGFGIGNLNDAMMEAVSNAGNGIYSVISSAQQADEYVHERLLSTFVPIAKDMKLQLEFNAERVHAFRLLGYENRAIADEDFRDDQVDAGEVGAGHRVTALYQLILKGGTIPRPSKAPEPEDGENYAGEVEVGEDDLVLVKVRYKKPGASEEDEAFEVARGLPADEVAESTLQIDSDFRWALAVAAFAEIVKKSPYAVPNEIDEISELVHESVHRSDDDRAEFVTLFDKAVELGVATR